MGGICSKSSHLTGGHTLGSAPPIDNSGGRPQQLPQQQQQQYQQYQQQHQHRGPRQHPPQTAQTEEARRSQAAAAAERRMKAEHKRGVNAANPNSGRLAAQLEASKSAPVAPEPSRREDTLIDDWRN